MSTKLYHSTNLFVHLLHIVNILIINAIYATMNCFISKSYEILDISLRGVLNSSSRIY